MAGYVYDAGGMRTHKASGTVVYSTVNGYPNSFATVSAFTLYPSELITVSSGMYTKHYYNGSSRIASRIGGGFNRHNDLNNYRPALDHVQLQNGNDYTNKAQQLRNVWSRNASCAGLDQNLEYAYSLELNPLFANPQPDGARYFYHSDHLGSSAYITTENGYATQFLAYMPFGETLSEQQNSTSYYSPFKFSAKEKDPETGYSYFGARYYSPELSVWLSFDPLADHPNQVDKSPYAYAWNNPITYTDPDGKCPECPVEVYLTLANHVYEAEEGSVVDGWTVVSGGLYENPKTGFKGALYKGSGQWEGQYIFATAGTDFTSFKDWKNNIEQVMNGLAPQYLQSVSLARKLVKQYSGLSFTGHSLGGGLASANALGTESKGVTFNAAGISSKTKAFLGLNTGRADITAFVVDGEALSFYQGLIGLKAEGRIVTLPADYIPFVPFGTLDDFARIGQRIHNHSMKVVYDKLNNP